MTPQSPGCGYGIERHEHDGLGVLGPGYVQRGRSTQHDVALLRGAKDGVFGGGEREQPVSPFDINSAAVATGRCGASTSLFGIARATATPPCPAISLF
jgi:hypothetical protein